LATLAAMALKLDTFVSE